MTIGKGIMMICCKQTLNTWSSTVAEVVAADNVKAQVMDQEIYCSSRIHGPEESNV